VPAGCFRSPIPYVAPPPQPALQPADTPPSVGPPTLPVAGTPRLLAALESPRVFSASASSSPLSAASSAAASAASTDSPCAASSVDGSSTNATTVPIVHPLHPHASSFSLCAKEGIHATAPAVLQCPRAPLATTMPSASDGVDAVASSTRSTPDAAPRCSFPMHPPLVARHSSPLAGAWKHSPAAFESSSGGSSPRDDSSLGGVTEHGGGSGAALPQPPRSAVAPRGVESLVTVGALASGHSTTAGSFLRPHLRTLHARPQSALATAHSSRADAIRGEGGALGTRRMSDIPTCEPTQSPRPTSARSVPLRGVSRAEGAAEVVRWAPARRSGGGVGDSCNGRRSTDASSDRPPPWEQEVGRPHVRTCGTLWFSVHMRSFNAFSTWHLSFSSQSRTTHSATSLSGFRTQSPPSTPWPPGVSPRSAAALTVPHAPALPPARARPRYPSRESSPPPHSVSIRAAVVLPPPPPLAAPDTTLGRSAHAGRRRRSGARSAISPLVPPLLVTVSPAVATTPVDTNPDDLRRPACVTRFNALLLPVLLTADYGASPFSRFLPAILSI